MTVKLKLSGLETFSSPACRVRGVSKTVKKGEVAAFSDGVAALLEKGGRHHGKENIWVPNWVKVADDTEAQHDFSDLQPPTRKLSRMEELALQNKRKADGSLAAEEAEKKAKEEADAAAAAAAAAEEAEAARVAAEAAEAAEKAEAQRKADEEAEEAASQSQRTAPVKRSAPVKRTK